jgi:hypothetical protein
MLEARYAFVPQPIMGKTPEQLMDYITGNDPVTGLPVMKEIIDGLTAPIEGPLDASLPKGIGFQRLETPRLLEADTEDNLHALFLENNWTDKLPIVLPTEERVAEMLKHTSHAPDEVVGHMRPTGYREAWEYTVEKIAVNAVMAGCRPEYFPVVLALASSENSARSSSSSSMAVMAVVNGPIRHEIGMNWGTGALGPFNQANATIGRAYGLLSQNLQGGSVPNLSYMGSMGNNLAYNNITFAENEEQNPWGPFHVEHGFKPEDSTVSVFSGCRSTSFLLGVREEWEGQVRNLLRGMDAHSSPTFLLDPIAAQQFIDRAGFDTKEKLVRWVHENGTMKAKEFWNNQSVINYVYPLATYGEEPWASLLKADPEEMIRIYPEEDIHVIVVGGGTNAYWRIMGANHRKTISIDAWR